tara:strand:+ start:1026 stop:1193 length:168 start_codon:yes stop_codon:yes gene_type:complete
MKNIDNQINEEFSEVLKDLKCSCYKIKQLQIEISCDDEEFLFLSKKIDGDRLLTN